MNENIIDFWECRVCGIGPSIVDNVHKANLASQGHDKEVHEGKHLSIFGWASSDSEFIKKIEVRNKEN